MHDLVRSSGSPEVERFVDALVLAMERGTPLADLLRAQAADARAAQARRLMESAGRKDVSMLIPVVFLILPTVVLIALFPGFRSLHLFVN
jgi:tight adherence protein C